MVYIVKRKLDKRKKSKVNYKEKKRKDKKSYGDYDLGYGFY